MPWVKMTVREWVPDDAGGMLALELIDAQGLLWTFVERPSVVAFETINASTTLPKDVWVECLPCFVPSDDSTQRTISLSKPHGITAQEFDGVTEFVVRNSDYRPIGPAAEQTRDEIVREIYSAFRGVSRQGGLSWSMCEAEDLHWSSEGCAADPDTSWEQLVDDKGWQAFPGIGGFSFIDHIGFRYYAPVVMIRMLSGIIEEWFGGHFLQSLNRFAQAGDGSKGTWNAAQMRCTARFVQFMAQNDVTGHRDSDDLEAFQDALSNVWAKYLVK